MPNHYNNSFPTDKASTRYYSYIDLIYSKIICIKYLGKLKAGKAVIINKNVDINLTYNGILKIGYHSVVANDASIILTQPKPTVHIKQNVLIGKGTLIYAKNNITIGNNTRIGAYTTIRDHMHHNVNKKNSIIKSKSFIKDVSIGDNVWIGNYCTIFPGVKIGNSSIISTYSFVTDNVPEGTLVAGQPARVIKKL